MSYIIETEEQAQQFIDKNYKSAFIKVISANSNFHPALNNLSLVYIKPYNEKGFITSHSHNEAFSLCKTLIDRILDSIGTIYSINKKELFYYFSTKYNDKIVDLNFNNEILKLDFNSDIYSFYYNRYPSLKYTNKVIPILKHYEYCELLYEKVKHLIGETPVSLYNNKASLLFYEIESQGIKVEVDKLDNFFKLNNKDYSVKGDKIYTNYNLYTLTKRPANSFNNINFLALNKTNGCKKIFIPENDVFVELDISAYHPTIISHLIDYDFKGENIHEHFAKLYNVDYKEAKELTFKQIYGNIFPKYKNLEFFRKVQEFINKSWSTFQKQNKYITDSGLEFKGDLSDSKLFNYIIQEKETSLNLEFIEKIIELLRGKKSKLILYVFDSFLIDFAEEEKELIKDIEKLFKDKKFDVKIKYKNNLD